MTWRLWRWLMRATAPAADREARRAGPSRAVALALLAALVLGAAVTLLVPPLLLAIAAVLLLAGTLRGLLCSMDAALALYRWANDAGWTKLQATQSGAYDGALRALMIFLQRDGAFHRTSHAIQRVLNAMLVCGVLAAGAAVGWLTLTAGAAAGRAALDALLPLVLALAVVWCDHRQSLPLGLWIGLRHARASRDSASAALWAAVEYVGTKVGLLLLAAMWARTSVILAVALVIVLQEGLLHFHQRVARHMYDAY